MPKFLDVHPLGNYTEDELKKYQELLKDELAVKVLNILYNEEIGISFCFLHAPSREAVEKHHEKFGVKCNWITESRQPLNIFCNHNSSCIKVGC
jgi:hypothetical protein